MLKTVKSKISAIIVVAATITGPTIVSAAEIALTFENHDVTIVGEFSDFKNESYIILTENGEIHVPAMMVTCTGDACVNTTQASAING